MSSAVSVVFDSSTGIDNPLDAAIIGDARKRRLAPAAAVKRRQVSAIVRSSRSPSRWRYLALQT